jgi:hypothetical protein
VVIKGHGQKGAPEDKLWLEANPHNGGDGVSMDVVLMVI